MGLSDNIVKILAVTIKKMLSHYSDEKHFLLCYNHISSPYASFLKIQNSFYQERYFFGSEVI
jgi:hypothetical protein